MMLGAAGIWNMMQGQKQLTNLGNNQPSSDELRQDFSKSQGLIDRMTNFNQYSGPAMDLASMQGNQGVETALMSGMGGSQANAIRNRLKSAGLNKAYQNFTAGLGDAARLQSGLDDRIFGQVNKQRDYKNQLLEDKADFRMGIGKQLMPEGGLRGLLGIGLSQIGINQ